MDNSRYKDIVRYSIIGIAANVVLAAFKAVVGIIAGSIAVILDGVNSLTDAFASIATIIGEKIATRRPSREHPFGYGRVEYVTSIAISAFVMGAGVVSLWESIMKIVHPQEPDYSALTIIVLVVATVVKVGLGIAFVRKGKDIKSQPLSASGIDSMYDAILTFGTLVAAVICLIWHIDLDGWVGAVISLFVVKAGIDILRDAVRSIIGERVDKAEADGIRSLIASHEGVLGVYDLMLDTFGPETMIGSCHIEVPDEMTATQIHELTRSISEDVYEKFGCALTIGIYATNSTGEFAEVRNKLSQLVESHDEILQMHGFFVDVPNGTVDFDIVVDFGHDSDKVRELIVGEMKDVYPNYDYNVVIDTDYS